MHKTDSTSIIPPAKSSANVYPDRLGVDRSSYHQTSNNMWQRYYSMMDFLKAIFVPAERVKVNPLRSMPVIWLGMAILLVSLMPAATMAQLERRTVVQDRPVELTFMAPRSINLITVEPLSRGEMHYAIMHSFGEVSNGWRNFYGIDNGAVIRLSLEYGITDRASVWIGRSSLDKVFEAGGRYKLLRQMESGSVPLSVSVVAATGLNGSELDFPGVPSYDLYDRTTLFASVIIGRKFNERFSLQAAPMVARFNRTGFEIAIPQDDVNYLGLGMSGRYKLRGRLALTAQYMFRSTGDGTVLRGNMGVGLDIETGGHVFQLFFTNSQALNDMYLLAGRAGDPLDGAFRFGFNVNRLFMVRSR